MTTRAEPGRTCAGHLLRPHARFADAIAVEARKAAAARVLQGVTVGLTIGVAVLCAGLLAAVRAGNAQVISQLEPLGADLADPLGWPLLIGIATQVTAAGGLLAFGLALSWSVGREFTEGTISGVFALPVPRHSLALAKLVVHAGWVVAVAVALTGTVMLTGLALHLGDLHTATDALLRLTTLTVATGLITVPAAWAATLGRGLLPGIAATVAILVLAQVTALAAPDVAGWIPLAAPALWALFPGSVSPAQLALVLVVPVGFAALTALAWHRLRLDE